MLSGSSERKECKVCNEKQTKEKKFVDYLGLVNWTNLEVMVFAILAWELFIRKWIMKAIENYKEKKNINIYKG